MTVDKNSNSAAIISLFKNLHLPVCLNKIFEWMKSKCRCEGGVLDSTHKVSFGVDLYAPNITLRQLACVVHSSDLTFESKILCCQMVMP